MGIIASRIEAVKKAWAEVEAHCMCAHFEDLGGTYRVLYPQGFRLGGVQANYQTLGKLIALERMLIAMERHWLEDLQENGDFIDTRRCNMGKLVLTRKAGEAVIITEANGTTWRLDTVATKGLFGAFSVQLKLSSSGAHSVVDALKPGQSMTFGGGNVELRPSRRGQEVVLAFEFPREVKIMREELA